MESKKNNYKKPAMRVLEIQDQECLLGQQSDPYGQAREQNSNWSSEDWSDYTQDGTANNKAVLSKGGNVRPVMSL